MKGKLFINYRRDDTAPYAGRLYDRLTAHFGEDQVFIDIDQIDPGEDFVEVINRKVSACDIAIVSIGPRWLSATDASGKRRLDDEEDFVRMEIVAALERNIRVIPVLVGGAQMPRKQDLPEALASLSRRNAIELSETRFHADVNRLIEAIEKSFAVAEKKVELSATPDAAQSEPEKSQQDSIAITKLTTSFKSTQTKPATSAPVPDTPSFKEPKGWNMRWILASTITLFLLVLAGFLIWPRHQKAGEQGSQPVVAGSPIVTPAPARLSAPAEAQSMDQRNAADKFNRGMQYEYGRGLPIDFEMAAELYQEAADQGNADAQFRLGWLYEGGSGVPKDLEKARGLYQKAADQGNADAQFRLGFFYQFGKGVDRDLDKARELYQKAASQGFKPAIFELENLSKYKN